MEEILSVDTETTGLGPKDRAFGISWQHTGRDARYIDIRRDDPGEFLDTVANCSCKIVCHNGSYDYRMLHNSGIDLPIERLDDTVIRATMINEHEYDYRLDALAKKHLGRAKDTEIYAEMARLFGGRPTREAQIGRIADAPKEIVSRYAIPDAELAHDLWQWQDDEIQRQDLSEICEFERSVMPSIIRNEMMGVRVDTDAAERAVVGLTEVINVQTLQLQQLVGKKFNVNSPKDVGAIFQPKQLSDGSWITFDGTPIPSTPGGKPSFSADSLRDIGSPVAQSILDIRSMIKTRDTFLLGHVLGNQIDGRVYPNIHQTKGEDGGTGTGRFSYTDPALQQIPSRNIVVAAIVKSIFLPDEGQVWVDGDMHSFEARVFAHLVNNPKMIAAYLADPLLDLHQFVADLTGLPRKAEYSGQANAKQLNLSMIFNSGRGAIAEKMGMPFSWDSFTKGGREFRYKKAGIEADRIIDQYHAAVPGVKELANRAKKKAEVFGHVRTQFGRHLRFPRGERTYKASGLCIQATAADINKKNWVLIEEALAGTGGRLVLNTHDSYGLSLPEDWMPHWKRVQDTIQNGFPWFRVPIILELSGAGPNWWAALEH